MRGPAASACDAPSRCIARDERKKGAAAVCAMGAALVLCLALIVAVPAGAQGGDPWSALATVEAQATISAIEAAGSAGSAASQAAELEAQARQAAAAAAAAKAEAAQRSARATQQAADLQLQQAQAQATVNAVTQATRTAQEAQATQSALDELNRQRAATAAAEGQIAQASATSQALNIQATRTAYTIIAAETKQRSELGTVLLYLLSLLAVLCVVYVTLAGARALVRRLESAPVLRPATSPYTAANYAPGGDVVDATPRPRPMLPAPTARMSGGIRMVDNPELGERIEAWFYGGDDDTGDE
jgi:hypothetical protein